MSDFFDQLVTPPAGASAALPASLPAAAEETEAPISADAPTAPSESPGTPVALKSAVQDLLRCGLIERQAKPNLYRTLTTAPPGAVSRILEPFDLSLTVDDVRGIAFLVVPAGVATNEEDAWQHPLVRRQRLTTEQSLLIAILRQAHIAYEQQYGIGAAGARVALEDLRTQFDLYLGDSGSESRNQERLLRVLSQLQAHGIVSEPDKDEQVSIRPIIVHLANPEHLQLLLLHFKHLASGLPRADAPALAEAGGSAESGETSNTPPAPPPTASPEAGPPSSAVPA